MWLNNEVEGSKKGVCFEDMYVGHLSERHRGLLEVLLLCIWKLRKYLLLKIMIIIPSSQGSACNEGDLGLSPGSGRSPGEGNGNPLQYSCLENPMDGGAWRATVHGVLKSWTRLSDSLSLSHVVVLMTFFDPYKTCVNETYIVNTSLYHCLSMWLS